MKRPRASRDRSRQPWWNAADTFRAYYDTMRHDYGMTAKEALAQTRRMFADYPEFARSPITALRAAMKGHYND